jgi:hypothetical protein
MFDEKRAHISCLHTSGEKRQLQLLRSMTKYVFEMLSTFAPFVMGYI